MLYIIFTHGALVPLQSTKIQYSLTYLLQEQLFAEISELFAFEEKSSIYVVFQNALMPDPHSFSIEMRISTKKNIFRTELVLFANDFRKKIRTILSRFFEQYHYQNEIQIPFWILNNGDFFLCEEK